MFCVHDSRRFTVQGLGFKVQGSEYAGTLAVFCVRDSLSGFVFVIVCLVLCWVQGLGFRA